MYAGAAGTTSNYGYYLYTGNVYWSLSPFIAVSSGVASVFRVSSYGQLLSNDVDYTRGVRPVISLTTNNTITGSGTISDPYIVN